MQLKDLIKPIDQMSDEELLERLRTIRNNRTNIRPAAKARSKRAARKGQISRMTAAEKLLAQLSPEDRAAMLLALGETS